MLQYFKGPNFILGYIDFFPLNPARGFLVLPLFHDVTNRNFQSTLDLSLQNLYDFR
jgi:hypothetical protein